MEEVDIKQSKIDGIVKELQNKCNALSLAVQKGEEYITPLTEFEIEIKKLKAAQKRGNQNTKVPDRRNFDWKPFLKWLKDNKFPHVEELEIGYFPDRGHGIISKREIKAGDRVVEVPLKFMMTNETAIKSKLALLLHNDQMLQNIYTVSLSLHLLLESRTLDSFWGPYINSLPKFVPNSPLFWGIEEILQLKALYAMEELVKFKILCVKAYTHIYFRLEKQIEAAIMKRSNFTYDAWAWAFSTVHSRQNKIMVQGKNGPVASLALVPVYDLINHEPGGVITSHYNMESLQLESTAVRDFKKGEEIKMFYAERPNVEMFVYSGFIIPDNIYNWATLRLELPSNDPLKNKKLTVLNAHNIPDNPTFAIYLNEDNVELWAFLRITALDTDEDLISAEQAFNTQINVENEIKACRILESALNLKLQSYPTTLEQDQKKLKSLGKISTVESLVLQLQIDDKYIFTQMLSTILNKINSIAENSTPH